MPKDRRKTTATSKAATRQRRTARRAAARRRAAYTAAAQAAQAAGFEFNAMITIRQPRPGIETASRNLWRRLRQLARQHGKPFIAIRAPEYAQNIGSHLHVAMHLHPAFLGSVASIVADVTGSAQAPGFFNVSGRRLGNTFGVVAKSAPGDWMLQRHVEGIGGSSMRLVSYTAKGSSKHDSRVFGRHQVSADLSRLVKCQEQQQHRAQAA